MDSKLFSNCLIFVSSQAKIASNSLFRFLTRSSRASWALDAASSNEFVCTCCACADGKSIRTQHNRAKLGRARKHLTLARLAAERLGLIRSNPNTEKLCIFLSSLLKVADLRSTTGYLKG